MDGGNDGPWVVSSSPDERLLTTNLFTLMSW